MRIIPNPKDEKETATKQALFKHLKPGDVFRQSPPDEGDDDDSSVFMKTEAITQKPVEQKVTRPSRALNPKPQKAPEKLGPVVLSNAVQIAGDYVDDIGETSVVSDNRNVWLYPHAGVQLNEHDSTDEEGRIEEWNDENGDDNNGDDD